MSRDLALLLEAGKGFALCRLYEWDGPWVGLGRFQKPEDAIVPGFTEVVVRPTGGQAVLHGHDLTVAIAIPFAGGSVKAAYFLASQPILDALSVCEANPMNASDRATKGTGIADCFASSSPYDLLSRDSGAKIAGLAMRINRRALLLQASIPYQSPLVEPSSAIVGADSRPVREWNFRSFPSALEEALRRFEGNL